MYQNKITLTPQEIFEKEFKIDTRGYRLKEVDQFLDVVIGDYEQFLNIINDLEKEKADLLAENMNLKQELRNTKLDVEAQKSNESNDFSNVDIIRRLSQLEKIVYSMKKEEEENNN
jgi:DivIVA domain-containing protein